MKKVTYVVVYEYASQTLEKFCTTRKQAEEAKAAFERGGWKVLGDIRER